jgi:hypothetical protein
MMMMMMLLRVHSFVIAVSGRKSIYFYLFFQFGWWWRRYCWGLWCIKLLVQEIRVFVWSVISIFQNYIEFLHILCCVSSANQEIEKSTKYHTNIKFISKYCKNMVFIKPKYLFVIKNVSDSILFLLYFFYTICFYCKRLCVFF